MPKPTRKTPLFVLLVACLSLSGCNAIDLIAGVPVQRRAMCRGEEMTNAADSTGTRALGSVYGPMVPCNNTTRADTLVWP